MTERIRQKLLAISLSIFAILILNTSQVEAKTDKVVCYYASWAHYRTGAARYTVDDIPVELCTHVIYAFAILDPITFKTVEHDSYLDKDDGLANYRNFVKLRQRNPNAKMLVGLGGWTDSRSNKYSQLVANPELRADFITHVVQFLKYYGFDGLDLDWEYPGYEGVSSDKEGFSRWVEELRAAFNPHGLLLTAAVSAGKTVIDNGYDVPSVARALDQIHIMSYDFHGPWERQVNHHSPLFPAPGDSEYFSADFAVRYWIKKGAKPSKLVLGVPFYGKSWTLASSSNTSPGAPASGSGRPGPLMKAAGTLAYYEICSAYKFGGWNKVSSPAGPYLTLNDQWVGYDDINAIISKTEYAKSENLGGIMVWDTAMDDFRGTCKNGINPLLNVIATTIDRSITTSTHIPPTRLPTRPTSFTSTFRPTRETEPTTEPSPSTKTSRETEPTTVPSSSTKTSRETEPTTAQSSSTRSPPVSTSVPGQLDREECITTGYTKDPRNCSSFYQCTVNRIFHMQCPKGLYWYQELRICNWPSSTPCNIK